MITVFYGSQVYGTYETWKDLYITGVSSSEVYQGGYVYHPLPRVDTHWYRCDGTPCLIEDVPKVLQMLQLVLNL